MLRGLLGLLSTAQLGARLKISAERLFRQAAILSVAAIVFIAALVFGLIAAYQGLVFELWLQPVGGGSHHGSYIAAVVDLGIGDGTPDEFASETERRRRAKTER